MDAVEGTPEYQPNLWQKISSWVGKRAPFAIGRAMQMLFYWMWKGIQFLGEMFHDAIGR